MEVEWLNAIVCITVGWVDIESCCQGLNRLALLTWRLDDAGLLANARTRLVQGLLLAYSAVVL